MGRRTFHQGFARSCSGCVSIPFSRDYEFGADDLTGTPIEELVPDYGILDQLDYSYPVQDATSATHLAGV